MWTCFMIVNDDVKFVFFCQRTKTTAEQIYNFFLIKSHGFRINGLQHNTFRYFNVLWCHLKLCLTFSAVTFFLSKPFFVLYTCMYALRHGLLGFFRCLHLNFPALSHGSKLPFIRYSIQHSFPFTHLNDTILLFLFFFNLFSSSLHCRLWISLLNNV